VLDGGGASLDAVVAAVQVLEDDPLFNAGRGAVLAASGQHELDASVMDGRDLRAGAVTGVRHVRSPIELARLVMERSPHVMLAGAGAEEFALEQGLAPVPNAHFATERRRRELDRMLHGEIAAGRESLMGTVGAVARDSSGNLAAATSTGGMTGKKWGRVGDSPIIAPALTPPTTAARCRPPVTANTSSAPRWRTRSRRWCATGASAWPRRPRRS